MDTSKTHVPRRTQFSLLNFILLMTAVGAGLGLLGTRSSYRAMEAQNQELRKVAERLRSERGDLTIDDPSKVHAIRVPEIRDRIWTYRVYLPPGDTYFVACRINELSNPDEQIHLGRPPGLNTIMGIRRGSAIGLEPGEHLLTFAVFKNDGDWRFKLTTERSVSGSTIKCDETEWPELSEMISEGGVFNTMEVGELSEPLKLLDFRSTPTPTVGTTSSSDSKSGVIVWIDRVSNYTN